MPVDSAAELQVHSSKEAGILLLLWSENTLKAACNGTAWLIRSQKKMGSLCSTQLLLAAVSQVLPASPGMGRHIDHGPGCSHGVTGDSFTCPLVVLSSDDERKSV